MGARAEFLSVDKLAERLERAAVALRLPAALVATLARALLPERFAEAGPAGRACRAGTGTAARVQAMAERAANGEALHHPADNADCGATRERGGGRRSPGAGRAVRLAGRRGVTF